MIENIIYFRESCSNAVHLESVVEEMKARLTTLEEREAELLKLRVDLGVAEGKLAEYRFDKYKLFSFKLIILFHYFKVIYN